MNTRPNKIIVFSPKLIKKDEDYEDLTKFLKRVKKEIDKNIFSEFIIFDDGSKKKWKDKYKNLQKEFNWLRIEYDNKNLGVAKTLLKAYISLSKKYSDEDIIVRLDSDDEHDPSKIKKLTEKINTYYMGAICQIKYKREHQKKKLDKLFNKFQGIIQGNIVFGKGIELKHNCPGFTAYKIKVLKEIFDKYEQYLQKYKDSYHNECRWGGDLIIMFLITSSSHKINLETTQDSIKVAPNRDNKKILDQLKGNTQHLILMLELNPKREKELEDKD